MAVMNTTRVSGPTPSVLPPTNLPITQIPSGPNSIAGSSGGGMSPSATPSPVSSMGGMGSPHQPGIGMKPGTQTPPANVLQVVKQVIIL